MLMQKPRAARICGRNQGKTMLRIFAVVLFMTTAYCGAAYARGGGAESMPMTNFTDLPDYRPKVVAPCQRGKHMCDHARWHQSISRGN
jgi:hypothetical protein